MSEFSLRAGIRRRLGYLAESEKPPLPIDPDSTPRELPDHFASDGWQEIFPQVYRRQTTWEVPELNGRRLRSLVPADVGRERCLFFDTETTGLMGAGTLVFLFGMAWIEHNRLTVEQVFLSDYGGETSYLQYLEQTIAPFRLFVSFNGKSFDRNVLSTRFLLDGRSLDMADHLDLLYPSRRLWSRLTENCRLTTLEQFVLGQEREGDVEGWEVPEIYFSFLTAGVPGRLASVFKHNELDVVTLARLLGIIDDLLSGGQTVAADRAGLGHVLLARNDSAALQFFQEAFVSGDAGAGEVLACELKRCGRLEEAVSVWETLVSRFRSVAGAVELAKHLEHRVKDYDAALAVIRPFLGTRGQRQQDAVALVRRALRLENKRQKTVSADSS